MLTGYSDEAGLLTVVRILKPFSTVLDGESPFYGTEAYAQEACIRGVPPKNKKSRAMRGFQRWWAHTDSNRGPKDYESSALTN